MTVSASGSTVSYAGNDATTTFAFPYEYQLSTNLVVTTLIVASGVHTTLVLGTDYTVIPEDNSPATNGSVHTTVPVASGTTITITREVPLTQLTTWQSNDAYPANFYRIENALDKLTLAVQDTVGGSFNPGGDASTFVRGDGALSNTLVGSLGAITVPTDVQTLFNVQQDGAAAIKIAGGATSQTAYRYAKDGSANPWEMQWVYDPNISAIGWQAYGGSILGTFADDGTVTFAHDLAVTGDVDVTGTTNSTLYTGAADASLITTGTIATARLGSGAASSSTFLRGDQTWAVVSGGGGGINTTTTGTFVIAAVNSTQTVPVTDATGIVVGTELIIGDGSHQITGLVTAVASLNLTVKTQQISLGSAGNTMASGAAVQSGTLPGNNTILLGDGAISPSPITDLQLFGSVGSGPAGATTVDLFIQSLTGGSGLVRGYVNSNFTIDLIHSSTTSKDRVAIKAAADTQWLPIAPTAQGDVLHATSSAALGFSKLTASDSITAATITPALLNLTNSLTDTYLFGYDSGTSHFKMFAQSAPFTGTAAQFMNGAGTPTNTLSALSGAANIVMAANTPVSDGVRGLQVKTPSGNNDSGSLRIVESSTGSWIDSATRPWMTFTAPFAVTNGSYAISPIDGVHGATEAAVGMNSRTVRSARADMGFWGKMRAVSNPTGTQTINPATCPYVRFESILADFTIAIADTSDAPTVSGVAYASEITIEFDLCTHTITWPGTINWVDGGSAPTPDATGYTLIRLVRAQDVGDGHGAVWFGYRLASSSAAAYTDAQARSAVIDSTYLLNSSTIDMAVVAGTSTTPFVKAASIGNTQLAGGIQLSKLQTSGTANSTTFLRGDGAWAIPAGGGGSFSPNTSYTWTAIQTYVAKNNFLGPQTFNSNGFGSPVGSSAAGVVSFNNYYPNDNLSPETACAARITLDNSYLPGVNEELTALCVSQTNRSAAGGGQGCVKVGLSNWQNITAGFSIALTQTAQQRRINGGAGDGVWLNSWSPNQIFSGTPDAQGITHSYGSGFVRVGEINAGNAWADFGRMEDRLGSRFVAGLEFFPDWLPGDTGATSWQSFPISWAIAIGAAANRGGLGTAPQNWTGILMTQDGLVGGANVYGAGGFGINIRGGSTTALAPAIGVKIQDHIDVGVDTTSATITPEATSGHSNQAAINIASGQAICFKQPTGANTGVYIAFNGTNLRATKDGGNTWTTIV